MSKLFKNDLRDIRDEDYSSGPDVYSDVKSDGFEITGHYDWQSGFVRLSYVDIDTEINGIEGSTSGYYLGTPIGRAFKIDLAHSFEGTGITAGSDIQHYFAMDGNNGGVKVEDAFAEYTVANAFVSYVPQGYNGLTLRASVNNLFDEAYADRASYGQEYAGVSLKEPGRSLVLSAKLNF